MPDSYIGLAEITLINNRNLADLEVTDLLQDAPLLAALPAQTASNGHIHSYLKEILAPNVGFRKLNEGRSMSKSGDVQVDATLEILDASWQIDQMAPMISRFGLQRTIRKESQRHLRAAFKKAENQLINGQAGTDGDATGFRGLVDAYSDLTPGTGTPEVILDSNPGLGGIDELTSIWMMRVGDNDVSAVIGNGGNITIHPTTSIKALDAASEQFPAWYTPIGGWLGMQFGSKWSAVRIANIPKVGGRTVDDDLLSDGLELFPEDRQPNLILMNKRSRGQWKKSRTATNVAGTPAPMPTEYEGIPVIVSTSVLNTELPVA